MKAMTRIIKVINWLSIIGLLLAAAILGVFSLGSVEQYNEQMQRGHTVVFAERCSGIILLVGIIAALWWSFNWLLKSKCITTINLKALAIQLSVAVTIGATIGTALYCWH